MRALSECFKWTFYNRLNYLACLQSHNNIIIRIVCNGRGCRGLCADGLYMYHCAWDSEVQVRQLKWENDIPSHQRLFQPNLGYLVLHTPGLPSGHKKEVCNLNLDYQLLYWIQGYIANIRSAILQRSNNVI